MLASEKTLIFAKGEPVPRRLKRKISKALFFALAVLLGVVALIIARQIDRDNARWPSYDP